MNFIKALSFSVVAASSFLVAPAEAAIPMSTKYELCSISKTANDQGWSAKPMLEEVLVSQGQPKYLANAILSEIKDVCPKVY